MRRSVSFKRPYFHFYKTLSSALRFTPKWLLRDKRVWSDTAHMYFVFHHMMKFEHIHVPYRNILLKSIPRTTIIKFYFPIRVKSRANELTFNLVNSRPHKCWANCLIAKRVRRKPKVKF